MRIRFPRVPVAAGRTQLTMLPSGAVTVIGRKNPALFGMSERSSVRIAA